MSAGRIALSLALAGVLLGANAAAARRTCATLNLLQAQRSGAFGARAAVQDRPWDGVVFALDSDTYPLRVHYNDEVFADGAAEVLALAESAWQRQVIQQGFAAPLPDDGRGGDDRLDIYLTGLGSAEAATFVDDDIDPNDGRHAAPAHMRVNPASSILEALVHHEFQHTLQFANDASESLMWFESTAVLQEVYALGAESDAWEDNIPEFQRYTQAPPFTNGVDWSVILGQPTLYEYGAVLLPLYLDEVYGNGDGVLIRQLWEGSIQADDVTENEPDWMDALAEQTGLSLGQMIPDFATWRLLVGPIATPDDGPSVGSLLNGDALAEVRVVTGEGLRGAIIVGTTQYGAPHQLGCVMLQVRAEDGVDEEIEIQILSTAEPQRTVGVSWLIRDPVTDAAVRDVGGQGQTLAQRIQVPEGHVLMAAVCDLGDLDGAQPDADEFPVPGAVEIRVWNTRLPFGPPMADGGPLEPDPEPAVDAGTDMPSITCGCQQTAKGPVGGPFDDMKKVAFPLMLVIGGVSMVYRFRRARRRRKSFKGSGFREGLAKPADER